MNWRGSILSLRSSRLGERLIRAFDFDSAFRLPHVRFPVYLQLSKNLSEYLSSDGGKERLERELFRTIAALPRFGSFWDVGANIGQYTWEFVSLPGLRRAFLFEPDPRNAATIRKTVARSELGNCELIQVAVSDNVGHVSFNPDPITGKQGSIETGGHVERLMARKVEIIDVPCATLDSLVAELGLPPDMIKVDVEGAEKKVLAGAGETLRRYRPVLFMEVTAANFDDVDGQLRTFGYELFDAVTLAHASAQSFNLVGVVRSVHAEVISVAGFAS